MAEQTQNTQDVGQLFKHIEQLGADFDTMQAGNVTEMETLTAKHKAEIADLRAKHEATNKEHYQKLAQAKNEVVAYMKAAGMDTMLSNIFGKPVKAAKGKQVTLDLGSDTGKKTRVRRSPEALAQEYSRNKSIYTSKYPMGVDDVTGLPKRAVGKSAVNTEINRMMKQDEQAFNIDSARDTAASNGKRSQAENDALAQDINKKLGSKKK